MPTTTRRALLTILSSLLLLGAALVEAAGRGRSIAVGAAADDAAMAARVKAEFLHAWRGYQRHAWGHDDLKPLSRSAHDWYAQPLLMTPVDALDTMLLMGLDDEAQRARRLIVETLSFDHDIYVKNFEVTIRILGGLLSAYQMTGDARLLTLAEDLGRRLLPVFESPTGLPYVEVNLRTGAVRGKVTNPAETGTLLLEFGTLSRLSGDPVYYDKAKRALVETHRRRSRLGLLGSAIDVETGAWTDTDSHVAGGIDSYYEYLWKCWLLFEDRDCLEMWRQDIAPVHRYLADEVRDGELWYGHADMHTGKRSATHFGALDAFFPAVLALSGDVARAERLQRSALAMWRLHDMEPEVLDYATMRVVHAGYLLRPEIVESAYYLHHYTGDPQYRASAREMWDDFVRCCRVDAGYASLTSVVSKERRDRMESFLFAETFKYFYLLYASPETLDLDAVVFNTEAHPLRRTWRNTAAPASRDPAADLALVEDPIAYVDPLIGTANGGNTFPGAVVPFGMVQFSPENTRGDHTATAAPGGYRHDVTRIRGFALTHLSGTGCRGASGDVPLMPFLGTPSSSPSTDHADTVYARDFAHANESAAAGDYRVRFGDGIAIELGATPRTGSARFTFPAAPAATLLIRTSDSEVGSSEAWTEIDVAARTVRGSVTSGNFCGYLSPAIRRSYYTLHFVAEFDQPFVATGTWRDRALRPGALAARGGTGYDRRGAPFRGRGSGAWVTFDARDGAVVNVRVGISYVSLANAAENLRTENPPGATLESVRESARSAWNAALRTIRVAGGSEAQRRTFYSALYHALLHPNLYHDVNGEYRGFDGEVHRLAPGQHAQYANFSGWDVYRSQLQLVTWIAPAIGADIAQSLLNQALQHDGVWDRWTHNGGATHVMSGDPAAIAVASIHAFGGTGFDAKAALASLVRAASSPTADDLDDVGCPVACAGQRPSLDQWLKLGYIAAESNAWGGAAETLEAASADFAIAALARRLGDEATHARFLARSQQWRNLYNPNATASGGYLQNRHADGSWPAFEPATDEGFVEGSAAQYLWMVPFDPAGLFAALGGRDQANARLDAFFHGADGRWAFTDAGPLHAELDNEPSIGAPWLYAWSGQPHKAQATVRAAMDALWSDTPGGIPGNDDLGQMSSWYVWAALGMYPAIPGRAELVLGSPLFPRVQVTRPGGNVRIDADGAGAGRPYLRALEVDGVPSTRPWLPESFTRAGGRLAFVLSDTADPAWGAAAPDAPPSFAPPRDPSAEPRAAVPCDRHSREGGSPSPAEHAQPRHSCPRGNDTPQRAR